MPGDPTGDGKVDAKDASAKLGYYIYAATGSDKSFSEHLASM